MTHKGFGYGERKNRGVSILDFVDVYTLMTVNSLFKKEDHLLTFRSDTTKTQIDYFETSVENRRLCKDCKVILSKY